MKEQDSIHLIRQHPKWHVITYAYQHFGYSRAAASEFGIAGLQVSVGMQHFCAVLRGSTTDTSQKKKKKKIKVFVHEPNCGWRFDFEGDWSCTNRRAREITFVLLL